LPDTPLLPPYVRPHPLGGHDAQVAHDLGGVGDFGGQARADRGQVFVELDSEAVAGQQGAFGRV